MSTKFGPTGCIISGGGDFGRSLRFNDCDTGSEETSVEKCHIKSVYSMNKMTPGEIVTGSVDGCLKVWNVSDLKSTLEVQRAHNGCVSCLCSHPFPDKKTTHVFTGGWDSVIRLYDMSPNRGEPLFEMKEHKGSVQSLSSCGSSWFASCGSDGVVSVWDLKETTEIQHYEEHQGVIYCSQYNDSREILYTGGSDCTIKLWSPGESDNCIQTLPQDDIITSLCVVSDRGILVAGSACGSLYFLDERNTKHYLRKVRAHDNWVSSIECIEMSGKVITSGWDGQVKVFEIGKPKPIQSYSYSHPIYTICYIESHYAPRKKLVIGGQDSFVKKKPVLHVSGPKKKPGGDIFSVEETVSLRPNMSITPSVGKKTKRSIGRAFDVGESPSIKPSFSASYRDNKKKIPSVSLKPTFESKTPSPSIPTSTKPAVKIPAGNAKATPVPRNRAKPAPSIGRRKKPPPGGKKKKIIMM